MASTPETNPTEEQAPASVADDVPSAEPAEVEVTSAPADSQPPDVAGGPPPPPPSALKPKLSQRVAEPTEEGNEEAGEYGEAVGDYYEEGAEGEGAGYEGEEGAEGGEGGEGGEGEAGGEGEEDEEEDEEEEEDEATMRFYSERRYLGGGSIDGEKSIWASCYAQEANPFGKFEAEEAQTVEVEERVHLPLDGFGDSLLAKYEAVQEGSTHARSLLFHLQKGRARSDGRSVAFKVHGRSLDEQYSTEQSARESEQLRGLQHPGLVTLLDFYAAPDGQTAVFVTEALEGHDLFGQLLSLYGGEDEGPTEGQLRAVVRELVATVAYLHSQNIVHRDITTDVLYFPAVGSLEHLKVVDLHNAASADDAASDWPVNPLFQPPESIARQPCTFPVDVWAVGVLTFFLLCGHPPFHDANKLKLKIKIKQGQFELHPSVSAAAADFVSQCLRTDPSARPKAADLLNHPWLAASASASSSSSSATETKLSHVPVNLRKSVALP